MPYRKKNRSSAGCSKALYWITIGWVIWLFKWLIIALFKFGKFLVVQGQAVIERLSTWLHQRLAASGHAFSLGKVRVAVTGLSLVFMVTLCSLLGVLNSNNAQEQPPTNTLTALPTLTHTPTFVPTNTSIPPTPTPLYGTASEARCIPPDSEVQLARVIRVIDGDTIVVEIDGQEFHVRYIGIDSPEESAPLYEMSKEANEALVMGKSVVLVKDVSDMDSFDRLLRYIFVDELFVNYTLIHEGAAVSGSWPPDTACDEVFKSAESVAQSNQAGLWVATPTTPANAIAAPTPTEISRSGVIIPVEEPDPANTPGGNCDPSYPGVCIPPYPPDLNCPDISYRRFQVLPPDPHGFDRDGNGIGCESD